MTDDGTGDEKGELLVSGLLEKLLAGKDSSLAVESIENSLDQQDVSSTINQRLGLSEIGVLQRIKVNVSVLRVLNFLGERTGLISGTHGACYKTRSGRILGHNLLASLLGKTGRLKVESVDELFIVKVVVSLSNGCSTKGVGLNNICPSIKVVLLT